MPTVEQLRTIVKGPDDPVLRGQVEFLSRMYNIDPSILWSLIGVESRFNPNAVSKAGAYGYTQLMPKTGDVLGVNRYNPIQNVYGGAKYYSDLMKRFKSPELALQAYHEGPTKVAKRPPRKSTIYSKRVQDRAKLTTAQTQAQQIINLLDQALKTSREKGPGFLGTFKEPGTGKDVTEKSIGVPSKIGLEEEIPMLVPTLTQTEIDYIVSGGKPTRAIVDKAVAHADMRKKQGKNPFKEAEETEESIMYILGGT